MGDQVEVIETVKIRPYPKAVFLYPSFVAAVACAVLAYAMRKDANPTPKLPGDIFFTIFSINILITAWDFSKAGFITVILLAVLAVCGGLLWKRTRFA